MCTVSLAFTLWIEKTCCNNNSRVWKLFQFSSHPSNWQMSEVLSLNWFTFCDPQSLVNNVKQSINQHLCEKYTGWLIEAIGWRWKKKFSKNWWRHSVKFIWLYGNYSYEYWIFCSYLHITSYNNFTAVKFIMNLCVYTYTYAYIFIFRETFIKYWVGQKACFSFSVLREWSF